MVWGSPATSAKPYTPRINDLYGGKVIGNHGFWGAAYSGSNRLCPLCKVGESPPPALASAALASAATAARLAESLRWRWSAPRCLTTLGKTTIHLAVAEAGANRDRRAEAKEFRFQLHGSITGTF
jgi:hypothetical protein